MQRRAIFPERRAGLLLGLLLVASIVALHLAASPRHLFGQCVFTSVAGGPKGRERRCTLRQGGLSSDNAGRARGEEGGRREAGGRPEGGQAGAKGAEAFGVPSLVFIKTTKTGGSTVSGVVRRIGDRYKLTGTRDPRWDFVSEPGVWAQHALYRTLHPRITQMARPPFLLSWVRHPVNRCLSNFYYERKGRNVNPPGARNYSDGDILAYAQSRICNDRQGRSLSMPGDESAGAIVKRYDFIGTTERFQESMLLLRDKLPMPVALRDILYIKSKDSSRSAGLERTRPYAEQSQRVRDFFDSERFTKGNAVDLALWHAANEMLDRQVADVGPARLSREGAAYKRLLAEADARCYVADKDFDCYNGDEGCGIACLDSVAAQARPHASAP